MVHIREIVFQGTWGDFGIKNSNYLSICTLYSGWLVCLTRFDISLNARLARGD